LTEESRCGVLGGKPVPSAEAERLAVARPGRPTNSKRISRSPVDSTRVCLSYGKRIEEVMPPRDLPVTSSKEVEKVGLARLAGGLDA
jgi:hypothetical protein